jgi:hypothetical protein
MRPIPSQEVAVNADTVATKIEEPPSRGSSIIIASLIREPPSSVALLSST